ncbi:hypothetical protein GCM10011390_27170 [Aureimonas endophytica]|uniref:Argininosuccinate lyase n=1 Tax=Aureimonas endophytica TaxID=2027858 RepID=A0A916ZPP3_9HYPH|nr:hypothetical protein [Aureimonas endophytica]GGE06641.1 hypothetical protein GCM10011390_27170 [Aureimonas endophytica]
MIRALLLASLLAGLAGCGGMTRAVGVLPNTLDDLSAKSEPFRRNRAAAPEPERVPAPPGGF